METHIIIDRGQALWAAQKLFERYFHKELKGKTSPASVIHTVLNGVKNSPAYAIQGLNVIYLQKQIPPEFLPMILNHEELHLLTFDIFLEEGASPKTAMKLSGYIDKAQLNAWLCDAFNIDMDILMKYLQSYILANLPIIGLVVRTIRRIRNAFS